MPVQSSIEWKSTWKDEYMKWICGFANAQGCPEPRFEVPGEDLTVTFYAANTMETVQATEESVQATREIVQAPGAKPRRGKKDRIMQEILAYCVKASSLGEIAEKLGLRHIPSLRAAYIKPLLGSRLEMSHPENPRHMHQRYRIIK